MEQAESMRTIQKGCQIGSVQAKISQQSMWFYNKVKHEPHGYIKAGFLVNWMTKGKQYKSKGKV